MTTTSLSDKSQIDAESKKSKDKQINVGKRVILVPGSGYMVKHLMAFWAKVQVKLK